MHIDAQKTGECISALMLQGHIYLDFHTTLINTFLGQRWPLAIGSDSTGEPSVSEADPGMWLQQIEAYHFSDCASVCLSLYLLHI